MGFDAILRSGIATADTVTASLQATVAHSAWTAQDVFGAPTFAAAVNRAAIVEIETKLRQRSNGQLEMTIAKVTFLRPIAANGADDRTEPIDYRDKIVLPDGTTGPIVDVKGIVDPTTNLPYMTEVLLGDGSGATR